jgi:NADPH:quinone reductase-like Zn-dependent oxidoreductase
MICNWDTGYHSNIYCASTTQVGDAVAVNASAAFAEYCLAKERLVTVVPPQHSRGHTVTGVGPEAAVLSLSGMTAIAALEVSTNPLAHLPGGSF